jgi:hypothetical protein
MLESQLGCLFSLPSRPASSALFHPSVVRLLALLVSYTLYHLHLCCSSFFLSLSPLTNILMSFTSSRQHQAQHSQGPMIRIPAIDGPARYDSGRHPGNDSPMHATHPLASHCNQTRLFIRTRRRPSAGFLQAGAGAWRRGCGGRQSDLRAGARSGPGPGRDLGNLVNRREAHGTGWDGSTREGAVDNSTPLLAAPDKANRDRASVFFFFSDCARFVGEGRESEIGPAFSNGSQLPPRSSPVISSWFSSWEDCFEHHVPPMLVVIPVRTYRVSDGSVSICGRSRSTRFQSRDRPSPRGSGRRKDMWVPMGRHVVWVHCSTHCWLHSI